MALTFDVLQRQDDVTSTRILGHFEGNSTFAGLAEAEGNDIVNRDKEDATKLAEGIQKAIDRGVLPKDSNVAPTTYVEVIGKSADEVALFILESLKKDTSEEGKVIVLQGLSGTGKGTTVEKLRQALPKCVCWSNGNVFRCVTHLVSEYCEEKKEEFSPELLLKANLLPDIMARLSFEKCEDGSYDVLIDKKTRVSEIQNTTLKMPHISKRIPTVAGETQGEVVKFASGAVAVLQKAGHNVILEGRAQTLNYIPSPHRFELVIPEVKILGQRRAAQRVSAEAANLLKDKETPTEDDVKAALAEALSKIVGGSRL